MIPEPALASTDDIRPEYDFDFAKAERGRYASRIKAEGLSIVMVEADSSQSADPAR